MRIAGHVESLAIADKHAASFKPINSFKLIRQQLEKGMAWMYVSDNSFVIVHPQGEGLHIAFAFSTHYGATFRHLNTLIDYAKNVCAKRLTCIAHTPAHARLYERLGFSTPVNGFQTLDIDHGR